MLPRKVFKECQQALQFFPVLGLVGPRQVGKTTLAKELSKVFPGSIYLDVESPSDYEKLQNAETFFSQFENRLIIIDEIQFEKSLFPIIRSAVDKNRRAARFIVLGSASPGLIRSSAESLAGRIAYIEIGGLNVSEVNKDRLQKLWLYGGYPEPFINTEINNLWKRNYIQTYLERDLPLLGLNVNPVWARRLWQMLAHWHGQTLNLADLSKSLEVDAKTIRKNIDFLEQAFIIRQLTPYHSNGKKRLVKSPKIYFRDSGLLHHLLSIQNIEQLIGHPKMGASWEGFIIEQIFQHCDSDQELFFYRTHHGAEIDLVISRAGTITSAVEIKFGDKVNLSRGNSEAVKDLNPTEKIVIKQSEESWVMKNDFQVLGIHEFIERKLNN